MSAATGALERLDAFFQSICKSKFSPRGRQLTEDQYLEASGKATVIANDSATYRDPHSICVMDAKSLFDALNSEQSQGDDDRSALETAIIRESLSVCRGRPRWVPHNVNPSDSMTKFVGGHHEPLLRLLRTGEFMIEDEDEVLGRGKQAEHRMKTSQMSHGRCQNPAGTHLNLCALLSQMGKHQEALQHADKALKKLEEYPFSSPACSLDFSWGSSFSWGLLGCSSTSIRPLRHPLPISSHLSLSTAILLLPIGLQLGVPDLSPDRRAICPLMSNGLKLRLAELSKEADRLQVQVVELAESIADLLRPGQFGDWVRVDDEFPPLDHQEFQALRTLQRFQGLEDGYPPLPPECLRIVARALCCEPEESIARAKTAYTLGFLARIALSTETPLISDPSEVKEENRHWIILYRKTPAINRRVSNAKSRDIAITVEEDPICQGFRTVSELTVFCAGCGIIVPPLEQWTSPW
eukprot:s1879_g18.t1